MKIMSHITGQLNRIRNEVDVIAVYGGGSILMRQFLFSRLDALCNEREIKLLYVPESYATLLNAIGLDIFARGGIFKALKKSVMNGDANG
jgi:plasmid segregation protein ParM